MRVAVTGTDTGVGKTAVGCGLLASWRAAGLAVTPFKPVETGWGGPSEAWPPDALALRDAAGSHQMRPHVVPYVFAEPLAPHVAAERAGTPVDVAVLDAALATAPGHVLIEGAGGLAVPFTADLLFSDLLKRWNAPVVVVARAGLGTLNHTLLTVEHARHRGLEVLAVVLNRSTGVSAAERTNPEWVARLTGLPVWTHPEAQPGRPAPPLEGFARWLSGRLGLAKQP
ncbi:MAG: dethiobiotin synthase [Thermoplasmatota archaeon]